MSYPALVRKVEDLAEQWAGSSAAVSIDTERGGPAVVTIWDAKGYALLTFRAASTRSALVAARDDLKKRIDNQTETMP